MKKNLLNFFYPFLLASFFSFQVTSVYGIGGSTPVPGTTCSTAFTAVKGNNHSDHTGIVDQWFTYTATSNCLITISSCGKTTKATNFYVFNNCSNAGQRYARSCGSTLPYQSQLVFEAISGQTFYIQWLNAGAAENYDWSLTESPLPAGSKSSTAIPAVEGDNSTYHYGNAVDQWYSFSPNVDGLLTISFAAAEFRGKNSGTLFIETGTDVLTQVARLGNITSIRVTKEKKYYIRLDKDNSDLQSWSLTFQPMAAKPGDFCELPIAAVTGINSASNATGSQWFSYTPSIDGRMILSTCGMTTEDTKVYVYDGCNVGDIDNSDDNCGEEDLQTEISINVTKGTKYLIKWDDSYTKGTYNWSLSMNPYSSATAIKSFSFTGNTVSSTIDAINHTVNVVLGKNVTLSALDANFELSDGATATIGSTQQISGSTSNDFTTAKTYTITAEDKTTKTDWVVTVTNASNLSNETAILNYTFTSPTDSTVINAVNHNVKVYVPYNLTVTTLFAEFTLSNFASASIGATPQISGSTFNDFSTSKIYTITAENGTTQNWEVQVIINVKPLGELCSTPKIVIEGVNKSDKIFRREFYKYTPTQTGHISVTVNCINTLRIFNLRTYSDCSTELSSMNLRYGEKFECAVEKDIPIYLVWENLEGETWTLDLNETLLADKEITSFGIMAPSNRPLIDRINHTITAIVEPMVSLSSLRVNLRLSMGAKAFIGATQIISDNTIDFTMPVTITVKAQNGSTQDYLVTVTHRPLETGNSITSFVLNEQTGPAIIDNTKHTIKLGVATGTNLTNLIPKFTLSTYATAKIGLIRQNSGVSTVDLTNSVVYSVTSEEVGSGPIIPDKSGKATTQDWTVTVTEGVVKNIYADITSIRLNEQTKPATIDIANKTVTFLVAKGTDRTALVPTFYLSAGATAKVGTTSQVSGTTSNNFTTPVVYAVTSEDGLTTKNWTVRLLNSETSIIAFSLPSQTSSTIDAVNKTIAVVMPQGSNITNIIPSFTLSAGASASIGTTAQTSGVTTNNFSSPVVYAITSEDGFYSQNWTVNVSVASGINDDQIDASLCAYPNPSNGVFHIKLSTPAKEVVKLDVFSITGAIVVSKSIDVNDEQIIDIDLTGKQSGIYYIRFQSSGKTSNLKLILK